MSKDISSPEKDVETSQKYYHELDCIRGIAIFTLLCFHTAVLEFMDMGVLPEKFFISILFSFSVPVFFFLSGLGLTIKYKDKELNLREFYKSRYLTLIPAYLIWSFLITAFVMIGDVMLNSNTPLFQTILSPEFIANFIINYLIGALTGHVYTVWFVFVLFFYYLIFPAILKLFKSMSLREKQIIIIIVFFLTILSFILNAIGINMFFIGDKFIIYEYSSKDINYVIDLGFFFRFIPYFINFLLGIYIAFNYEEFKKSLKENNLLKVIIVVGCFFSYIFFQLIQIECIIVMKYVVFSICSIYLLLLIFSQGFNWSNIGIENDESFQDNEASDISWGKKIKNKCIKFWWFTGQKSTGLYFTHRVVMAAVWIILYFILGITLWNEFGPEVSRAQAFLYCSLSLVMIYIGCLILIKIIRKLPYNEYIIGK